MSRQLTVLASAGAALVALAACSPVAEPVEPSQSGEGNTTATARASTVEGVSVEEETDLFSYKFAYPAEVSAIPTLAREIESRADKIKLEMQSDARSDRTAAADGGFPFRQHSLSAEWKVVADLPDWLSLTNEFATYTGGAHGNYGVTSLVWDKPAGQTMEGVEMFTSPGALTEAVAETYCPALDRQRQQKNGMAPDPTGTFGQCPGVSELTIIPGSSNGRTFDRVGFYAGPYVAGSYAEGSYEVTLPVDAKIFAAVKPEFRDAFSSAR
ncbi:DUF4163 domain-containing protein [Allopontixanthobacter sediminis]|uniref:DUF4163 domain-containing protein n=1 Tax=Allopontixanthobacter sediminis TaxID=1689985 RepID=A0A845B6X2_9SPHN|nr:DUF4163 domain-containing protein [Allopontixanthobacter sediminis]MXP45177.1 DUF4163 domain-containing protein [Allopontixanthobacter sediminis]